MYSQDKIVCKLCGREYTYSRKKGHTKTKCNSCLVNERRFKIKSKCLEYKGCACQICGYSRCKEALTFHHIDPSTKKFGISGSHARKWASIQKELDKCILVCNRCHSEIEYGLIKI